MADFTGRRAIAQNLQKDGLKIRATSFKNKKKYTRKDKYRDLENH